MADYDGILLETTTGDMPWFGEYLLGEDPKIETSTLRFSTAQKHGGNASRELWCGEKQSIWCGCDVGIRRVSVWTKPPISGKCALRVIDPDTKGVMGEAFSSGENAWEELNVEFTAEKKLYIVQLLHFTKLLGLQKAAYFDDFVVE